jgi:hypothetical protein
MLQREDFCLVPRTDLSGCSKVGRARKLFDHIVGASEQRLWYPRAQAKDDEMPGPRMMRRAAPAMTVPASLNHPGCPNQH